MAADNSSRLLLLRAGLGWVGCSNHVRDRVQSARQLDSMYVAQVWASVIHCLAMHRMYIVHDLRCSVWESLVGGGWCFLGCCVDRFLFVSCLFLLLRCK